MWKWYILSRDITANFPTEELHQRCLPEIFARAEQTRVPHRDMGSLLVSLSAWSQVYRWLLSHWKETQHMDSNLHSGLQIPNHWSSLTGESKSAQHSDLITVVLAVRHSLGEKQKVIYIFIASRAVAHGIIIWSQKWAKTDIKINSKEAWSRDHLPLGRTIWSQ